MRILLFSVGLFTTFIVSAQQLGINVSARSCYYYNNRELSVPLKKAKSNENIFEQNSAYSTSHLHLKNDSTFIFYHVDAQGYQLSVGRYVIDSEIYILSSDSILTAKAVADPEFYRSFFKFKQPIATAIHRAAFTRTKNELLPYNSAHLKPKIELLYTSDDYRSCGSETAPFKRINYDASGKNLILEFDHAKEQIFPSKNIWGFIILKNGVTQAYRRTEKGFNWYGVPGARIVQHQPFVIYVVGEGRLYNFFSRTLDSKIAPLTLEALKKEFKERPAFLKAVEKEFGKNKTLSQEGSSPDSYRVAELFNQYPQE